MRGLFAALNSLGRAGDRSWSMCQNEMDFLHQQAIYMDRARETLVALPYLKTSECVRILRPRP